MPVYELIVVAGECANRGERLLRKSGCRNRIGFEHALCLEL